MLIALNNLFKGPAGAREERSSYVCAGICPLS
jgi:hypothetical protein